MNLRLFVMQVSPCDGEVVVLEDVVGDRVTQVKGGFFELYCIKLCKVY